MRWIIVLRRVAGVLLSLLLVPLLLAALATSHACGTLLSPSWHAAQLREAEIYDFLYDQVLGDEVARLLDDADELPPGLSAVSVADAVRAAFPPEWLQSEVEGAIEEVGPYVLGQSDGFAYSFSLSERAQAVEEALVALLLDVDAHAALFDERVPEAVDDRLGGGWESSVGVALTPEEAVEAAERVLTPEFLRAQQREAVRELAAYLTGRTDTFRVSLSLADRAEAIEEELTRVLRQADLSEYARGTAVDPLRGWYLSGAVVIADGLAVTEAHLEEAVDAAFTPEWTQEQWLLLLDSAAPYLSGRADGFSHTVPLAGPKASALQALILPTAKRHVDALAASPVCSGTGPAASLIAGSCPPPVVDAVAYLLTLGIDLEAELARRVFTGVPDEIVITHDGLRDRIGDDALALIDELRRAVQDGVSFDDADLREELESDAPEALDALDNLRRAFGEGWTWTEQDLEEYVASQEDSDLADALADLDGARPGFGIARFLGFVLPLASLALLAAIGAGGGRTWPGRLGWAGGALTASAMAALLVVGVPYAVLSSPPAQELRANLLSEGENESAVLLVGKLVDVTLQAGESYMGGVVLRAAALLLLGAAAIAGGVALRRLRPPQGEGGAPP